MKYSFLIIVSSIIAIQAINAQFIDGYIYDGISSDPLEGVFVTLYNGGEFIDSTHSDALGYYGFDVDSKAKFKVYLFKKDYKEKWYAAYSNDREPRKEYLICTLPVDIKTFHNKPQYLKDFENIYYDPNIIANSLLTYDDPLRYFENISGVSQFNDQSNAYDFQGIPARFQKYFLNGIEIFNPNIYPIIGSQYGLIHRNGGIGLSFPNISALSFGNSKNNFNVSSIGANLALEIKDFDSFGKISNLGLEYARYSDEYKFALKVQLPNALSRIGSDNGFQQGGGVSALLNTRKVRRMKLVEYNVLYSINALQANRIPLNSNKDSSEIIKYSAPSQNLHISRIANKGNWRTEFGGNLFMALSDLSYVNQFGFFNTVNYQFKLSNYLGIHLIDKEKSSLLGLNCNLYTFLEDEEVDYYELVTRPQFNIKYQKMFFIEGKKITMTLSPSVYPSYTANFSPDFYFAYSKENSFDFSISHNSQIDELTRYFGNIIKSLNFEGKHYISIGDSSKLTINPFIHLFYNFDDLNEKYVPLNQNDLFVNSSNYIYPYRSYGLSVAYTINIGNGYDVTANTTLLNAKFQADSYWAFSDLSYGLRGNLELKKSFAFSKSRGLQVSVRIASLIGARSFNPYIVDESQLNLGAQGPKRDNYRIDAQLSYKGKNGTLNLSIANILNTDNPGYPIIDPVDRKYKNSNQTKFLPVISYTFDL